jgi:peroxiredoxin
MRKILFSFLVISSFLSCINDEKEETEEYDVIHIGQKIPEFDVVTHDGQRVTTDSLLGHKSVVVLFNTTCPDCQRELPRVDSLYRTHRDDADFRLVCIAREQLEAPIQAFWEEKGLLMPYSPQPDRKVYSLFAHSIIPRIYIASTDGVVRFMHNDQDMPLFQQLDDEVESLH